MPEPDALPGAVKRARDLSAAGKSKQAVSLLQEAIVADSEDWQLHDALGDALLAARRDEEAIAAFMAAQRLNPRNSSACVKVGRCYLSRGLIDPGLTWLRHALDVDVHDGEALASLATAEAQFGCREQARALLDSWIAADPENHVRRHLAMAVLGEATPTRAPSGYVTQLFDDYAARFDESLDRLHYCGPELIASALDAVTSSSTVRGDILDVGCGTGLVGEALRPRARRLVGVDLSEKMLEEASKRQIYDELHQVEMCEFMASRPAEFDVVTASDVLTYVGDLGEFCTAARRALRDGGWMAVVLEEMTEEAATQRGYRLNPTGRFSHSETQLRRWLETSEFQVRGVSRSPMRHQGGQPIPSLVVTAEVGGAGS